MGKVAKHSKPLVIALTMLLMVKAGFACSLVGGAPYDSSETIRYIAICFALWFALIVGNLAIFFLRGRKGLWIVVLSAISMLAMFPLTVFSAFFFEDCGFTLRSWLFYDVIVFGVLFAAQLVSWIFQRRAPKVKLP